MTEITENKNGNTPSLGEKKKEKLSAIDVVLAVLVVLTLLSVAFSVFCKNIVVRQSSMTPTLLDGDRVVILKTKEVERGDIIVCDEKNRTQELLIKRVIAVGGDTFSIDGEGVLRISYLDGEGNTVHIAFREDYINGVVCEVPETKVPEGYVYIMGDNRVVSIDSRAFGPVPKDDILGKVIFVYERLFE